jgi:hypothetical protein
MKIGDVEADTAFWVRFWNVTPTEGYLKHWNGRTIRLIKARHQMRDSIGMYSFYYRLDLHIYGMMRCYVSWNTRRVLPGVDHPSIEFYGPTPIEKNFKKSWIKFYKDCNVNEVQDIMVMAMMGIL